MSKRTVDLLRRLDADELIAAAPFATAVANAMGAADDDVREVALCGAHKARLTIGRQHFSASELADSRNWLEQRGMTDQMGTP